MGSGSGGVTKTQFNNLSTKVEGLAESLGNLAKSVEGIVANLEKLTQKVAANEADEANRAPPLGNEQVKQLVAEAVAVHATQSGAVGAAPPPGLECNRGFFKTRKEMDSSATQLDTLLTK